MSQFPLEQIYRSFGGDLVSQATSLVPSFAYLPFYVKPVLTIGGSVGGNVTGMMVLKQREKGIEASKTLVTDPSSDEPLTTVPANP